MHEKDIKERWKVYFHNLFNDGYGYDSSSLDTREEDRNYKYYRRIQKQEVKEALKRMSNGKVVGPKYNESKDIQSSEHKEDEEMAQKEDLMIFQGGSDLTIDQ